MKAKNNLIKTLAFGLALFGATSCNVLDEQQQNLVFTDDTDYTLTENMVFALDRCIC
jgi:hypothetical protein